MLEYTASAGTSSIGTVNARGDMQVDSYTVNGNATLFNGSVVKTNQVAADLRLGKNVNVQMGSKSSGTLYSDHMVLQSGQAKLTSANTFRVDALGLHVAPNAAKSSAIVAVLPDNSVEVAAISGEFSVSGSTGVLANVIPGSPRIFAAAGGAADSNDHDWSNKKVIVILAGEAMIGGVVGGVLVATNGASPASR
jgi:hypothetical protein